MFLYLSGVVIDNNNFFFLILCSAILGRCLLMGPGSHNAIHALLNFESKYDIYYT